MLLNRLLNFTRPLKRLSQALKMSCIWLRLKLTKPVRPNLKPDPTWPISTPNGMLVQSCQNHFYTSAINCLNNSGTKYNTFN